MLRLLHLEPDVQAMVRGGRLAAGHARALLGIENGTVQRAAAERIVQKGMSVREAESHVSALVGREHRIVQSRATKRRDADVEDLENRLRESLGTKVKITGDHRRGKLEIHYFSSDELEGVVAAILALNRQGVAGQHS